MLEMERRNQQLMELSLVKLYLEFFNRFMILRIFKVGLELIPIDEIVNISQTDVLTIFLSKKSLFLIIFYFISNKIK